MVSGHSKDACTSTFAGSAFRDKNKSIPTSVEWLTRLRFDAVHDLGLPLLFRIDVHLSVSIHLDLLSKSIHCIRSEDLTLGLFDLLRSERVAIRDSTPE